MSHNILDHSQPRIMTQRHDGFGMELNGCHRLFLMFECHDDAIFRLRRYQKIIRQTFRIGKDRVIAPNRYFLRQA
ncbi:hypothetical protein FQZ97_1200770 [compost metagenome]